MKDDAEKEKFSHLFSFAGSNKAGMEESDKSKQAKVIYEMSKGSRFFSHASKQDIKRKEKVDKTKEKISTMSDSSMRELLPRIESEIIEMERARNVSKICAVFDMDMFFAAVAIRDRPHLAQLPVAVGGMGMISTTNYVARKFGVRSAMPGFIGRKLCPDLVFVPSEFDKYKEASGIVKGIISEYDPLLQSYSLDEFFVDLTACARLRVAQQHQQAGIDGEEVSHRADEFELRRAACDIATEIRSRIEAATGGLTSSAGIANNFMLAKIAADVNKPNGQYSVPPSRPDILSFVESLPCRKVGGIGRVTEKVLADLQIHTMGDVRRNLSKILYGFTPALSRFLMRSSLGISEDELNAGGSADDRKRSRMDDIAGGQKSIGAERTFAALKDPAALLRKLADICGKVSEDLQRKEVWAGTITLKLKTVEFELMTKRHTLDKALPGMGCDPGTSAQRPRYIQSQEEIFEVASALLRGCLPVHVRLIGVQASKLRLSPTGRTQAVVALDETPLGRLFQHSKHKRTASMSRPSSEGAVSSAVYDSCDALDDDDSQSSCSFQTKERLDWRTSAVRLEHADGVGASEGGSLDGSGSNRVQGRRPSLPVAGEGARGSTECALLCDSENESTSLNAASVSSGYEDDSSWWEDEGRDQDGIGWRAGVGSGIGVCGEVLFTEDSFAHMSSSSYDGVLPSGVTDKTIPPLTSIPNTMEGSSTTSVLPEKLLCPVCGDDTSNDLSMLNRHLDTCLEAPSKKRGIKDYFTAQDDCTPGKKKRGAG